MKITKIIRDDAFVLVHYVTDGLASVEQQSKYQEQPTPQFDETLQLLGPIAANILEAGAAYTEGMTVRGLTIKRTKSGTKSVVIEFSKLLDAVDHPHRMKTPQFRMDDPADNEDGVRQCSRKQSEQISAMLEQAEAYVKGDRQQQLLPLPPETQEPQDGDAIMTDASA